MNSDRAQGILLGLACGDALGRPVEFMGPDQIARKHGKLDQMVGNGTHDKPAGTITDDTQLALCIARSLIEEGGFNGRDIASRFVEWYDSDPFDVGGLTTRVIGELQKGADWQEAGEQIWHQLPEGRNAGNGSVMRTAPYAIFYSGQTEKLIEVSKQSSGITHADPRCQYGCAILNLTLSHLASGEADPLQKALDSVQEEAPPELLKALSEESHEKNLENTGYIVHTLQTAFHCGMNANTSKEGIVKAVNLGGDTDTIGAVTGAIVGAGFGESELPENWIHTIHEASEIRSLADRLVKLN